jgi:hypothetical protein
LAGSAFSIPFGFGAAFSEAGFFFGSGDISDSGSGLRLFLGAGLFADAGVSSDSGFFFGFGVTSSSSPPLSLLSEVGFDFGVGDSSSSAAGPFLERGVFVGSGAWVGFALGFGVGGGVLLLLDFLLAGFGFAFGSGVSDGVGEAIARISSRALRFLLFSSSVNSARTSVPTMAPRARAVPR